MAVAGAVTGVAAAFGTIASAALTAFLVIIGNAAAAGPVGKPLLTGFYTTFNAIVPQGSGVALLRSVEYFGGNGADDPARHAGGLGRGRIACSPSAQPWCDPARSARR